MTLDPTASRTATTLTLLAAASLIAVPGLQADSHRHPCRSGLELVGTDRTQVCVDFVCRTPIGDDPTGCEGRTSANQTVATDPEGDEATVRTECSWSTDRRPEPGEPAVPLPVRCWREVEW